MRVQLCLSLLFVGAVYASQNEELDPADDPQFIERPCPDFDLDCIREYFTKHSQCQKALGPAPNPLLVSRTSVEFAHCNITADITNAYYKGLNKFKVTEFYFNKKTERLVVVVETSTLKIDALEVVFKYNRKGLEPIERTTSAVCDFGPLTFTAVFPKYDQLRLTDAEVNTYVYDSAPKFSIRDAAKNLDLVSDSVTAQYRKLITDVDISLQEAFVSQGTILMTYYLQNVICDFGLELK